SRVIGTDAAWQTAVSKPAVHWKGSPPTLRIFDPIGMMIVTTTLVAAAWPRFSTFTEREPRPSAWNTKSFRKVRPSSGSMTTGIVAFALLFAGRGSGVDEVARRAAVKLPAVAGAVTYKRTGVCWPAARSPMGQSRLVQNGVMSNDGQIQRGSGGR